jgi:hypothetical protein
VNGLDALPRKVSDLTYLARRYATDSRVIAPAYALAQRRSELFPFVGTDLLVEGYPRSANTYLLCALKWSDPKYKYASHMHGCGSIKYAVNNGIPTVILIREPLRAVVSLAIREDFRLDYCFEWYRKYYKYVAARRSSLVLADFSVVTADLERVYQELRSTYGLALRPAPREPSEISEIKAMVVYSESRVSGGIIDPLKVAVPTPEKRDAAPKFEREIVRSSRLSMLLDACTRQYHELVETNTS